MGSNAGYLLKSFLLYRHKLSTKSLKPKENIAGSKNIFTKQDSFEDDTTPFGLFTHNSDHHDFEWQRGSGIIEGQSGSRMIPFDHTTFGQEGHYLYINVSVMQTDYLNNMHFLEFQNGSIHQ